MGNERIAKLEARIARLEKAILCMAGIIDIPDDEAEKLLTEIHADLFRQLLSDEIKRILPNAKVVKFEELIKEET